MCFSVHQMFTWISKFYSLRHVQCLRISLLTNKKIAKAILRSDQVSFIPHSFGWRLIFQKMDHFYCFKVQRLTLNQDYFYFLSHYSVFYSVCVADWPLISLKSVHSLGKRRTAGQVKISVVSVDNYWDVVGRMNRSWMQILFSDFTF